MKKTSIFEFNRYKPYLIQQLEHRAAVQKGQRSRLSAYIGCKPAYLSLILNGDTELSPEQAQKTNGFLGHTSAEARYFLSLVLLARAGTDDLRKVYKEELEQQRRARLSLKERVGAARVLNEVDQARYYSAWYFAAIHVGVSLARMRTKERISRALALSPETVAQALEFLVEIGVLRQERGEYLQGEVSLYVGTDSPFASKHHTNWLMRAIQALDHVRDLDLHYSGVITCSAEDVGRIKQIMLDTIEKIRETVRPSADERMCAYNVSLFNLLRDEDGSN